MISDLGYLKYLAEEEDVDEDRIGNVNALFDDITHFLTNNPDSNFPEYLQNVALLTAQDDMSSGNYVSLMTIHVAKGLEFDYVGVIMGDDIRYENGHVVTDFTKRASTDQSIKGLKKMYKENPEEALERADEIIKNTYRTLMTRGMKGCYIYCTDPGMREYIRNRLAVVPKEESFVHSM